MICTILSSGEEDKTAFQTIKEKLREIIWQLYCEGYNEFYVNCEDGIPLRAAEIIANLKQHNQVKLNIVVPYEEQCLDWSEDKRDRYYYVHENSDTVEFVCSNYESRCYDTAVEMMIEESDMVIVFGSFEKAECYAEECGVTVKNIAFE